MKASTQAAILFGFLPFGLAGHDPAPLPGLTFPKPLVSELEPEARTSTTPLSKAVSAELDAALLNLTATQSQETLLAIGSPAVPFLERLACAKGIPMDSREDAVMLLGKIGGVQAHEALKRIVLSVDPDADGELLQLALFGMALSGTSSSLADIRYARHSVAGSAAIRGHSALVLAHMNHPSGFQELSQQLQTNPTHADEALEMLKRIGNLHKVIPDPDRASLPFRLKLAELGVQRRSSLAQAKWGSLVGVHNLVSEALRSSEPTAARIEALDTLAASPSFGPHSRLVPLSRDPDATIRSRALKALVLKSSADEVGTFCDFCEDLANAQSILSIPQLVDFVTRDPKSTLRAPKLLQAALDSRGASDSERAALGPLVEAVLKNLFAHASPPVNSGEPTKERLQERYNLTATCIRLLTFKEVELSPEALGKAAKLTVHALESALDAIRSARTPGDRREQLVQELRQRRDAVHPDDLDSALCEGLAAAHAAESTSASPRPDTGSSGASAHRGDFERNLRGALDENGSVMARIKHIRDLGAGGVQPSAHARLTELATLLESPFDGLRWEACSTLVKRGCVDRLSEAHRRIIEDTVTTTLKRLSLAEFSAIKTREDDLSAVAELCDAPGFLLELSRLALEDSLVYQRLPAQILGKTIARLGGIDGLLRALPDPRGDSPMSPEDAKFLERCHRVLNDAKGAGITSVHRFSLDDLERIVRDSKPNEADNRPIVVAAFAKADYNGAFALGGRRFSQIFGPEYRLLCIECESDTELDRRAAMLRPVFRASKSPGADGVMIFGHGGPTTIQLSEKQGEAHFLDLGDGGKLKNFGALLKPGGYVILDSCSTGKKTPRGENIASFLRQKIFPQAGKGRIVSPADLLVSGGLRIRPAVGNDWIISISTTESSD